ncbi:MAG: DUF4249 domain-containing protein [Bacteroidota bacterium]|nr:DUF4249 domain-containing protein [Bacteroidota bacterium]
MILFIALVAGCTVEFFPDADKNQETLVVEGMITDQDRSNRIRLTKSTPVGMPIVTKAVRGAVVTIADGDGIVTTLKESPAGTYSTDSLTFRGQPGSSYSLNIKVNNKTYETDFIELKPVPPISSLYYEKEVITASRDTNDVEEGCRVYVDSYDPTGKCRYFRWDYTETWEYRIPYNVVNRECYVTERSGEILIRNTSSFSQARISKFPVLFVSNKTDRLKETYSILVSQYSIGEPEYNFWERVRNVSQNVGNLYDVTPMAVRGNIRCITNPSEEVYGYFSVSAVTQKRLFIHDHFFGLPNFFTYCATDTVRGSLPETGLNTDFWVIEDYGDEIAPFWVISTFKECADCSVRGTKIKPPYWIDF